MALSVAEPARIPWHKQSPEAAPAFEAFALYRAGAGRRQTAAWFRLSGNPDCIPPQECFSESREDPD